MRAPTGIRFHAGPTILAVSAFEDEQAALTGLFRNSQWNIVTAKTREDAITLFGDRTFPVVLCERHLPDGDWKDVLSFLTKQPFPPKLIVMDRLADDQLWSEVLNVGGFDLLAKPFTARELFRSIVSASPVGTGRTPRREARQRARERERLCSQRPDDPAAGSAAGQRRNPSSEDCAVGPRETSKRGYRPVV